MVDIGDDPLADFADDRGDHRHAAGRHVNDLARIFLPVGQHVAAQQVDAHALMAAAFLGVLDGVSLWVAAAPCGGGLGIESEFAMRLFIDR